MADTKEKDRVARELREAKRDLKHMKKLKAEAQAVVTATYTVKGYMLPMFGHGHKKGGLKEHQKNRHEYKDRLRQVAGFVARADRYLGSFQACLGC